MEFIVMPIVVATLTPKPESIDTVREVLKRTIPAVHAEPGCELYALHESDGSFTFVEQWADDAALQTHLTSPAMTAMIGDIGEHLAGPADIKMLQPVPAGDPAKGQLVH
jgi:quinol monooxygenase YgiN